MILANGCPKSGTHALLAWLERLGMKRSPGTVKVRDGQVCFPDEADHLADVIHAHIPAGYDLGQHRSVTVLRDPRNVLVSYWRWASTLGLLTGGPVAALHDFFGKEFVPHYRGWLGWRGVCTIIRFEDLVS